MILNELFNPQLNDLIHQSYRTSTDDHSSPDLQSLRKSRLTLRQIRKLRKMIDAKRVERIAKLALVRKQYKHIPQKDR